MRGQKCLFGHHFVFSGFKGKLALRYIAKDSRYYGHTGVGNRMQSNPRYPEVEYFVGVPGVWYKTEQVIKKLYEQARS